MTRPTLVRSLAVAGASALDGHGEDNHEEEEEEGAEQQNNAKEGRPVAVIVARPVPSSQVASMLSRFPDTNAARTSSQVRTGAAHAASVVPESSVPAVARIRTS